jgi:hypothetical protein
VNAKNGTLLVIFLNIPFLFSPDGFEKKSAVPYYLTNR